MKTSELPPHLMILRQRATRLENKLRNGGRLPRNSSKIVKRAINTAVKNCDRMKAEATMRALLHVASCK